MSERASGWVVEKPRPMQFYFSSCALWKVQEMSRRSRQGKIKLPFPFCTAGGTKKEVGNGGPIAGKNLRYAPSTFSPPSIGTKNTTWFQQQHCGETSELPLLQETETQRSLFITSPPGFQGGSAACVLCCETTSPTRANSLF